MATLLPHLRPAIGLQAAHQLMNLDRHATVDPTLSPDTSSNALSSPQARHARTRSSDYSGRASGMSTQGDRRRSFFDACYDAGSVSISVELGVRGSGIGVRLSRWTVNSLGSVLFDRKVLCSWTLTNPSPETRAPVRLPRAHGPNPSRRSCRRCGQATGGWGGPVGCARSVASGATMRLCQGEKKSAVPRRDIYPRAAAGWAAKVG